MSEPGLVVARFRRHALVENRNGETVDCRLQGRRLRPVVGDEVQWRREPDGSATLETVRPRTSTLRRLDPRGRPEVVAANLSQLIVVLAPRPLPDWFLLDRYLCAAELTGLKSAIIYNKIDLVEEPPRRLDVYREVGYAVAHVSALQGTGLPWLENALRAERSALIGQSGVGKSSLFNALLGGNLQRVGDLSGKVTPGAPYHDDCGVALASGGRRNHRLTRRAKLRSLRRKSRRRAAGFPRSCRALRRMPFRRLHASHRTGLRGQIRADPGHDRPSTVRQLRENLRVGRVGPHAFARRFQAAPRRPLKRPGSTLTKSRPHLPARQHVHVHMKDDLPALGVRIDDYAVTG